MDFPDALPSSHYECICEQGFQDPACVSNAYNLDEQDDIATKNFTSAQSSQHKKLLKRGLLLKQATFTAMGRLEGWCSREKAALLIDIILALKPAVVVEIGVFGGKSLVPMALALKHIGAGKIYGIDPWSAEKSIEGMEAEHLEWWASLDHDGILNTLLQEMTLSALASQIELIRETSEGCPPIRNIDVLHIDGNHSEKSAYLDVTKWVPLMNEGGIVIFDDINWPSTESAIAWLDEHCTKLVEYSEENVWGIWIK